MIGAVLLSELAAVVVLVAVARVVGAARGAAAGLAGAAAAGLAGAAVFVGIALTGAVLAAVSVAAVGAGLAAIVLAQQNNMRERRMQGMSRCGNLHPIADSVIRFPLLDGPVIPRAHPLPLLLLPRVLTA